MRVLRRLLLGLAILVLLAIAAVIGLTHTARFNQLLLSKLNPYLSEAFAGRITIRSLTGSVLGKATLHDVVLENQGRIVAQIPRATISASLLPLLWRTIVLDIQIDSPAAALARDRAGGWNVLDALRAHHPAASAGASQWTVSIKQLGIHDGSFQITPQPDASSYRLTD